MTRFLAFVLALSAGWWTIACQSRAAGPRIDVVVGPDAPKLERFAAEELADQFQELFGAEVAVADKAPRGAEHLILLGSPATNPAVKIAAGDRWPGLSDQGHVLHSVGAGDRQALLVGGGSPVATLWAVYELGHRFGIRYLTTGDVYPAETPELKLDDFDVVLEPALRLRTWRTINDFAIGPESWGLGEQQRVLRQLAKLKFNRVMLSFRPWQPFVHYEFRGVEKQTALLWYGFRYPVDGDTAGRAAFRGATVFENPDFAAKETYEERHAAAVNLARGVIDTAHELGLTAAIALLPLEFPAEFAAALPEAEVVQQLEELTVGPGVRQSLDDPLLAELAATQLRACLDTYPTVDALYLSLSEFPGWRDHYRQAWERLDERTGVGRQTTLDELLAAARDRHLIASGERGVQALQGNLTTLAFLHVLLADEDLLRRADGRRVETVLVDVDPALYPVLGKLLPEGAGALHFVDYTARRVAAHGDLLAQAPVNEVRSSLILTLADDNVGVLPQLATRHLHALVRQLAEQGWEGYSTRYWAPGDLNPSIHYLARASFDPTLTPQAAYDDFLTPICGAGVAERVSQGYTMIEQATDLIDEQDIGFGFPVPGVIMKHYQSSEPPPAWWGQVRDLYLGAMNEMYRGITRARGGGRPVLLYHAKRCEFAFEYLNCVEAVRLAAQAKASGNTADQRARLEAAVESMYNALSALGEVARDNSDRGIIAVLNEYGYRPLQAELAKLDEGAGRE